MAQTLFNLREHHRFTQRHGDRILYSKGYLCPCGNSIDSSRARVTCTLCDGTGIQYGSSLELIGMVTGVHREKALLESGIAQPGDLLFSPSPYEKVQFSDWDKVELTWQDGQPFQGQLVKRAVDTLDDTLHYAPQIISRCFSLDPNTEDVTEYEEGVDFTVSGRVVSWIAVTPPEPGTIYSISYSARLEWVVFVPPADRREQDINLGQRVLLRARHVALSGRS